MVRNIAAKRLRLVPIGLVASKAIRRVQRIIVVNVAIGARCGLVRADQRETRDAVIEGSAVPTLGTVAVGAIRGSE